MERTRFNLAIHLLQDDLPWVEPLQVDSGQHGIKDPGDPNKQGKSDGEAVQQLEGFVLLCKSPDVQDQRRVPFTHFGGWKETVLENCIFFPFVTCHKRGKRRKKLDIICKQVIQNVSF